MSLPFRKDSIVVKALDSASFQMRSVLAEATKQFFRSVHTAAYKQQNDGVAAAERSDVKEQRAAMLKLLQQFDATVAAAREAFSKALEEYDLNVGELEAWQTAAKASEKLKKAASA